MSSPLKISGTRRFRRAPLALALAAAVVGAAALGGSAATAAPAAKGKLKVFAAYATPDRGAVGRRDPRGASEGAEGRQDRLLVHGRHRLLRRHGARPARGRREEQAGRHLRRRLRQRGRGSPGRQGLPEDRLRVRLRRRARQPELRRLRQLDPRAGLPPRRAGRVADEEQQARHRRRPARARGQPPLQRVHRRCAVGEQEGGRQGHVHQQLVRSRDREGSRAGADRRRRGRDLRRAGGSDRGRGPEEHLRLRQHVRPEEHRARRTSSRAPSGT